MSDQPAASDLLLELWHALAHRLLEDINNAETGELRASYMAEARAFLRDNGVHIGGRMDPHDVASALEQQLDGLKLPFEHH